MSREDANTTVESGKLRETTSFFLVAYFFPGCEKEGSKLPAKMVRDGYSTCFRTEVSWVLLLQIVFTDFLPGYSSPREIYY